ncbi:MAG: hypothetical protein QJR09_05185 [Micrococcus sp.]|nr:hypothetical protein [Micrococcus sp.]
MTTTATPAKIVLTAAVAKLSTLQMFEALEDLDGRAGEWLVGLTPEEVIVRDELIDAIEKRHRLQTATLDVLSELETSEPFGNIAYPRVLRLAMGRTGQTIA